MSKNIEYFYKQYLEHVSISNDQLSGCCPFHEDKNPSFSANLNNGLWKCHAESCGFQGSIYLFAEKLGVKVPEEITNILKVSNEAPQRHIKEKYIYTDEKGTILYFCHRYEPKSFSYARPDGNGGLIHNIQGVQRVLYRLPQIIQSQQVIIVEGEKDVERLWSEAEIVATTNPFGAGNWQDEYSKYFIGKDIVIIPDLDESGQRHAQDIIRSLQGKAKSIKLVELPEKLGKGGDVSDYFDKLNKTANDLLELISNTDYYQTTTTIIQEKNEHDNAQENGEDDTFPEIGGVAGDFAELYSNVLEAPKHFFSMSFLTCLGALLSGKITLKGILRPQPRLYIILLGKSGESRKSTAIKKTIEFFSEFIYGFHSELHICYGLGSAEGLQHVQKVPEEEGVGPKRVLLVYDEFKHFISKSTITGSVLLTCVSTLFESNEYQSHTKTSNFTLSDFHLSILGASTIDTYQNCWTSIFTDIGFNNRVFIIPGNGCKKYALPVDVSQERKKEVQQKLGEILSNFGTKVTELEITKEARIIFKAWYDNLENSVHTVRIDTYASRLMISLAINELKREVDREVVELTIKICNWQIRMRKLYDPVDADNQIAKTEEKIRRYLINKGPASIRDMQRAVHSERVGLWFFNSALSNLEKNIEVKRLQNGMYEYIDG